MEHVRDLFEGKEQFKNYRLLEYIDIHADLEDLKGDMFNPKHNPDINPITLKEQEIEFEEQVNREGVFGYVLEKWNPEPGRGWESGPGFHSCWGFVGQYDPNNSTYSHYTVEEIIEVALDDMKEGN